MMAISSLLLPAAAQRKHSISRVDSLSRAEAPTSKVRLKRFEQLQQGQIEIGRLGPVRFATRAAEQGGKCFLVGRVQHDGKCIAHRLPAEQRIDIVTRRSPSARSAGIAFSPKIGSFVCRSCSISALAWKTMAASYSRTSSEGQLLKNETFGEALLLPERNAARS